MDVTLAVCCDAANVSREGKLNLLGIFNSIHAGEYPATHPRLSLVLRVEAGVGEEGDHPLLIRFVDEDGNEQFKIEGKLGLHGARPGRPMTAQTVIDVNNLQIARPGTYAFDVFLDGSRIRSVTLYAFEQKPQG